MLQKTYRLRLKFLYLVPILSFCALVPRLYFLQVIKRRLPARAASFIRTGRIHAVMAHYYVVTRRLADAVTGAGGELYVWTVDDAAKIARFEAMGAHGVITNDPRLF